MAMVMVLVLVLGMITVVSQLLNLRRNIRNHKLKRKEAAAAAAAAAAASSEKTTKEKKAAASSSSGTTTTTTAGVNTQPQSAPKPKPVAKPKGPVDVENNVVWHYLLEDFVLGH